MPLVGIGTAFVAAATADLLGNEATRPFTRLGFGVVALVEAGLTVDVVATAAGALPI